jgi:hypothetical protein
LSRISKTNRRHDPPVPIEVRPDIGATLAASKADQPWFEIGHPDLIDSRTEPIWQCSGLSDARRWGRLIRHARHKKKGPPTVAAPCR